MKMSVVRWSCFPSAKFRTNLERRSLDCHECVGVSKIGVIAWPHSLLLLETESPDFVQLNVLYRNVADLLTQELLATLPGQHQQPENRITMQAGDALAAANARTFE